MITALCVGMLAGVMYETERRGSSVGTSQAQSRVPADKGIGSEVNATSRLGFKTPEDKKFKRMIEEPDEDLRQLRLISSFYKALENREDIDDTIKLYERFEDGPEKYGMLFSLLRSWAKTDPNAAFNYGKNKVRPSDRDKFFQEVFYAHAKRNPDEFFLEMTLETDPDVKMVRALALVNNLPINKTQLLTDTLAAVGPTPEKNVMLQMWVASNTADYPKQVMSYVRNLSDSDLKEAATVNALNRIVKKDPELATEYYLSLPIASAERNDVLPHLVRRFVNDEKGNTANVEHWMSSNLGTQEEKDIAASTIAQMFIMRDYEKGVDWLNRIEDNEVYNETVVQIEDKYRRLDKIDRLNRLSSR